MNKISAPVKYFAEVKLCKVDANNKCQQGDKICFKQEP